MLSLWMQFSRVKHDRGLIRQAKGKVLMGQQIYFEILVKRVKDQIEWSLTYSPFPERGILE